MHCRVPEPALWATALAALLLLALTFLWPLEHVAANGNTVEVYRGRAGEYDVTVGVLPARPTVGQVHFSVTPRNASDQQVVRHARILMVAHDPEGRAAYQTLAVNSPAAPEYYDANFTIEAAGNWTFAVELSTAELGDARLAFPLEIGAAASSPGLAGTVLWVLIFAALVVGSLYIWRSSRRVRRRGSDPVSR